MKLLLAFLLTITMMGAYQSKADDAPVTLTISPPQQYFPGTVMYHMRVAQHRDNFWTCFGWTNTTTGAFRKSCQQVNGIYGPRYFQHEYKWLEPGEYVGFVHVFRTPNYLAGIETQQFIILP